MVATGAEQVIDRFLAAWERADVDELLAFFADDAVWQPGPMKAVVGKNALREGLVELLPTGVRPQVHHTVSDGTMVMHERTDHFTLRSKEMAAPVAAAFEIDNGKIKAWREYFDMSPFISS
jgi:limonene-1,2-epoxide hydrolase